MIRGVVALPGQGKTLTLARWAEMDLRAGQKVAANIRLKGCDYIPSFADMLDWAATHQNGCIYISEAGVVLNSRNWAKVPKQVQFAFAQHRHFGLDLCWEAQRLGQVDKSLKDLSQYVTQVRKVWPGLPPSSKDGEYWAVPVFQLTTYEAPNFKKAAWKEYYFYSSRWAEMYRTSEILGEDTSDEKSLDAAMKAWQAQEISGKGLRIR